MKKLNVPSKSIFLPYVVAFLQASPFFNCDTVSTKWRFAILLAFDSSTWVQLTTDKNQVSGSKLFPLTYFQKPGKKIQKSKKIRRLLWSNVLEIYTLSFFFSKALKQYKLSGAGIFKPNFVWSLNRYVSEIDNLQVSAITCCCLYTYTCLNSTVCLNCPSLQPSLINIRDEIRR